MVNKVRVKQMINSKGYSVMNHFIITDGNKKILQSYDSIVAVVDRSAEGSSRLVLGKHWDYSRTTMKYLNQFIRQTLGWNTNAQSLRKAIANNEVDYDNEMV